MPSVLWDVLNVVLITGAFFAGTLLLFVALWAVGEVYQRIRGR